MVYKIIGAFCAVMTLSVVMRIPKKFIFYAGVVGATGSCLSLIYEMKNLNEVLGSFIGALIVALISHSFARIFKAPVIIFLIPGIIPLVPGTGMYNIVYNIIINNTKMSNYYFINTVKISGVIALAIFLMDSVFCIFRKKQL